MPSFEHAAPRTDSPGSSIVRAYRVSSVAGADASELSANDSIADDSTEDDSTENDSTADDSTAGDSEADDLTENDPTATYFLVTFHHDFDDFDTTLGELKSGDFSGFHSGVADVIEVDSIVRDEDEPRAKVGNLLDLICDSAYTDQYGEYHDVPYTLAFFTEYPQLKVWLCELHTRLEKLGEKRRFYGPEDFAHMLSVHLSTIDSSCIPPRRSADELSEFSDEFDYMIPSSEEPSPETSPSPDSSPLRAHVAVSMLERELQRTAIENDLRTHTPGHRALVQQHQSYRPLQCYSTDDTCPWDLRTVAQERSGWPAGTDAPPRRRLDLNWRDARAGQSEAIESDGDSDSAVSVNRFHR